MVGFQVLVASEHIDGRGEGLVLINIGIPPEARRQGHGRTILAKLLEIADNHGLPVSLEASERSASASWNKGWYARRGFDLTGKRGQYGPVMIRPANIIFAT